MITENHKQHPVAPARINLGEAATWTLRLGAGPVPDALKGRELNVRIPGTVHTDLLAHGLIPDPYLDENESGLAWLWRTDVDYRATLPPKARFDHLEGSVFDIDHALAANTEYRVDLVCEGLDTSATLHLNGVLLGETCNQHRTYRFDVRSALAAGNGGNHVLDVHFDNPLGTAESLSRELGFRPQMGNLDNLPFNAMRKMACNFGWDWGPTLTTSGVHKDMWLEAWRLARLCDVVPQAQLTSSGGQVSVAYDLEYADDSMPVRDRTSAGEHVTVRSRAPQLTVQVRVIDPQGVEVAQQSDRVTHSGGRNSVQVPVPEPELWWPLGFGTTTPTQPAAVYRVMTTLLDQHGATLSTTTHEVGFRSVELRQTADEHGRGFELLVNDQLIFVRGANWIPVDCFPHRVTTERREHLIDAAINANMNLLRIWGGGVYETDDFYQICNRRGMLVWQDFLFACAAYSEDSPLREEVEAEARENIMRLAPNPALVVWNGGNENIEGYYHWGWREDLPADSSWGHGYYTELFPRLLAELDGTRPYVPSSPYTPDDEADPRNPNFGTVHHWEVWNSKDYTHYASFVPRFCAEFGFQGPANWATIHRAIRTPQGLPTSPDAPVVVAHQKALDGQAKLWRGFTPHLPEPRDFMAWHWVTQLNQAHALRFGIEHFRSYVPRCTGTIIWQLNDCWPVTSWAAIDGDDRRKPLWFALREVYRDTVASLQPREGGLVLSLSNMGTKPWVARGSVTRCALAMTHGASPLAEQLIDTVVAPGSIAEIMVDAAVAKPGDAAAEAHVIALNGHALRVQACVVDKAAQWAQPEVQVVGVLAGNTGNTVAGGASPDLIDSVHLTFTAQTLIKDFMVEPAMLHPDLVCSDNWVSLRPGDVFTCTVWATSAAGAAALNAALNSAPHIALQAAPNGAENTAVNSTPRPLQGAAYPAPPGNSRDVSHTSFGAWPVLRSVNALLHL